MQHAWEMRKSYKILVENLKVREELEVRGRDGSMKLQ